MYFAMGSTDTKYEKHFIVKQQERLRYRTNVGIYTIYLAEQMLEECVFRRWVIKNVTDYRLRY